jgi:hypothetical protein
MTSNASRPSSAPWPKSPSRRWKAHGPKLSGRTECVAPRVRKVARP